MIGRHAEATAMGGSTEDHIEAETNSPSNVSFKLHNRVRDGLEGMNVGRKLVRRLTCYVNFLELGENNRADERNYHNKAT